MKERISHYRIIRELGRGGMGEVYLAEDTRLRRNVALKVLPGEVARDPRRVHRFLREAHAASALNHPNIATIHEVGEDDGLPYIAMEYLEGQTLGALINDQPLELNRIIDLALQIADALDEARGKGVVHRDLKPSNILINARGDAKVLDFGLAKVASSHAAQDTAGATDLKSDPGLVLGTVQYMSPEQALGRDVDHRSDLFSFGVVLYEMATARQPFSGKSTTETIERIVHQQPEAIARLNYNVPADLERIIRKCLEKDREWRYQSAREIVVDLKSLRRDSASGEVRPARQPARRVLWSALAAAGVLALAGLFLWQGRQTDKGTTVAEPGELTAVAVLPFSSLSASPSVEYLQFALPDEVTTILSDNPSLAIRPFSATRRLKDADPIEAGKSLNVDKVITGYYRGDNGSLGVTVEAIDVKSNRVVWRNSMSLPSTELIALRNRLSEQLRGGLLPALGLSRGGGDVTRPRDEEAYALLLRASSLPNDAGPSADAIRMLERAVSIDPDFATTWVHLARRYYQVGNYGDGGPEALARSRAAFHRALTLDPENVGAARGLIIADTELGDIQGAHRNALELVRRRPRESHARLSLSYTLRYAGRLEESARECDIAYALDANTSLRSCYLPFMFLGRYDRARDFLQLDEGSEWADANRISILIREGKKTEAAALLRARPAMRGETAAYLADCLETGSMRPEIAARAEKEGLGTSADAEILYFGATEMAYCGRRDIALRILRRAMEKNYAIYPRIENDPHFDRIRHDPDFVRLRAEGIEHYESLKSQLLAIEREVAR